MQDIFNLKKQVALPLTSVTAAATATSNVIDCSGYDNLVLDIIATTTDVVSDSPSVLKLQEADVTNASSFADVPSFVGGGASGFTIPNGSTATGTQVYVSLNVDTRARKRYLRLLISPRTTQTFTALVQQGRAQTFPTSASQQGVSGGVFGP